MNFIWDAEGRLAEEQTWDGGQLHCRKQYLYDGSSEQETLYCPEIPVKRRITAHDEGAVADDVSVFHYEREEKSFKLVSHYRETSVKSEDGTVRTEARFSGGFTRMTKDAENRLVEEVRDFNGSYHRETHQYDAMGREIEKSEWNRGGSIINRRTYSYSVDSLGNWIRRTEMFSSSALNEPVEGEMTVRAIEYY